MPRGLCQVNQCPQGYREDFRLDQGIQRLTPIQAARQRKRQRRVWPARDRLQPDPSEQHPQACHGGGMRSSQRHAEGFCWCTELVAELGFIVIFQIIPWDQLSQLDPAVVAIEFSSKREEEVCKRELVTMFSSAHVENSERLLGVFGPIRVHSTAENRADPL